MKLAMLSRSPKCYSTARLCQAAADRGHTVKVLNTLRFAIELQEGDPDLYFRSKALSTYDAALPRIGASITYFGTAVVRQFEQMDVYTPNSANDIMNSRDKLGGARRPGLPSRILPACNAAKGRESGRRAVGRVAARADQGRSRP